MKSLPLKMKIYLLFLYAATPISLFMMIKLKYIPIENKNVLHVAIFIFLSAVTESFSVVHRNLTISSTFAITFAAFINFGPIFTMLILVIGYSLRVIKAEDKYFHIFNIPLYKTLFNICVLLLTVIYSNYAFALVLNLSGSKFISYSIYSVFFFILNTLFISILKLILANQKFLTTFKQNFRLIALNIFIMAPFGSILSLIYESSIWGVILFLFPILLARYTFMLYIEVKTRYINTVDVLMHAMEARDKYTEGHSHRVASIVEAIAHELNYNEAKIEQLNIASLLHDVGKIGIDDNILNKPGKLTDEEYEIIKTHPVIGYNILKDINDFKDILLLVKHHHERFDGRGYPDGKSSEDLTLDVFIIQLADAVDAMATDRPYRPALHDNFIIDELKKNSGTQFHPTVVDAYIRTQLKKVSEEI